MTNIEYLKKKRLPLAVPILMIIAVIIIVLESLNIISVNLMVAAFILIAILFVVTFSWSISAKTIPRLDVNVIITFTVILGLLVFTTYISVSVTDFPINSLQSRFDLAAMNIILDREPTVMIPLYSTPGFPPHHTTITATIYHNPNDIVKEVKLSASTDSILSFEPKFKAVSSTLINNTKIDKYQLQASARHNLMVNNYTKPYTMDILYFNKTAQLNDLPFTFDWPVKTMDLSRFSYFWIVLIGVMVSRLLSLILNKLSAARGEVKAKGLTLQQALKAQTPVSLDINDSIWIAFSFIIALLIFSSFGAEVKLADNILTNITLAFGFGFGFDKVLEVAKKFEDIA